MQYSYNSNRQELSPEAPETQKLKIEEFQDISQKPAKGSILDGLGDRTWNRKLNRRDFMWLSSACGGLALTGCAANPVTGQRQFMMVSEQQEIAMDKQSSPYQFSADYGMVQDASLNRYLQDLGGQMGRASHRPNMPYNFRALNANYINAYAFPGGSIGITRGILVNLESEAELAALIGHELGHVNARHTAQRMSKSQLIGMGLMLGTVALGQRSQTGAQALQQYGGLGAQALIAKYSRDDERQADSLAMEYMVGSNYNPQGVIDLMELLLSLHKGQPDALSLLFSTHPLGSERYKSAKQLSNSGQYAAASGLSMNRERFMDYTAGLRRIKPAIDKFNKAEIALAKQQYSEAQSLAQSGLSFTANDYSGLVILGKAQFSQQQHLQARYSLERARNAYPQEAQAAHILGVTYLQTQQPEKALLQFNDYESKLPGNPATWFFQGFSYENMQDKQNAVQKYSDFLQQVQQGEQAQHAYNRLVEWGVIKPQQNQKKSQG